LEAAFAGCLGGRSGTERGWKLATIQDYDARRFILDLQRKAPPGPETGVTQAVGGKWGAVVNAEAIDSAHRAWRIAVREASAMTR
jgi:hypothetical protein